MPQNETSDHPHTSELPAQAANYEGFASLPAEVLEKLRIEF
jgi:hypothetical protein